MARKRNAAEQIITHLRQVEILLSQGKITGKACRQFGVTEQTCYRWRREYGGMEVERVERIWRREGLKVPAKQPKRGRLWLNDGSCVRLRPEYRHHVWSNGFVHERTHDGRSMRL